MSDGNLLSVVLFGSVARGDQDSSSDVDILAIVESRSGRVDDDDVYRYLPDSIVKLRPDISWYGSDRYREMSSDGQLFCWHIFLDGKILHDPFGYMQGLGAPAPYRNMREDIEAFKSIADGVEHQIEASEFNAVYELGVLYVCVRNVAMSASWVAVDRPDFTRNSPFHIKPSLNEYDVSLLSYEVSMKCRQASQRGGRLPAGVDKAAVLAYSKGAKRWISAVCEKIMGAI